MDSALQYKHVAVTETFGSTSVELRGEVGLLSHNVKVRGSSDDQWSDKIPKCEEGFDTGLYYKILWTYCGDYGEPNVETLPQFVMACKLGVLNSIFLPLRF